MNIDTEPIDKTKKWTPLDFQCGIQTYSYNPEPRSIRVDPVILALSILLQAFLYQLWIVIPGQYHKFVIVVYYFLPMLILPSFVSIGRRYNLLQAKTLINSSTEDLQRVIANLYTNKDPQLKIQNNFDHMIKSSEHILTLKKEMD